VDTLDASEVETTRTESEDNSPAMDTLYKYLPKRIQTLPVYMDFEGQKKAERIFQFIITVFAVVGFVWGWICQYFSQTVYILFAGFILACLLTLPPWPMYRRNPLKWQPAQHFMDGLTADQPPTSSTDPQNSTSASSSAGQGRGKKKKQ